MLKRLGAIALAAILALGMNFSLSSVAEAHGGWHGGGHGGWHGHGGGWYDEGGYSSEANGSASQVRP